MEAFNGAKAALDSDSADIHFLFLTDSTGESRIEWPGWFMQLLHRDYPTYDISYAEWWNGGTLTWTIPATVYSGSPGTNTVHIWIGGGAYGSDGWDGRDEDILQHPTDVHFVLIDLGHNGAEEAGYTTLIGLLETDWPSAHITLTNQNPRYDDYAAGETAAATIEAVATGGGYGFIDTRSVFIAGGGQGLLSSDGKHPKYEGRRLWAAHTWQQILPTADGFEMTTLSDAVALWQAKNYSGSGNWLDETATAADLTINGAQYMAHTRGQPYFWFPAINGNHLSTPDATPLDITGDLEIEVRVDPDDITPSASGAFVSKWGSGGARSYIFYLFTDGRLVFQWSTDGTATTQKLSTAAIPAATGDFIDLKVTLDVDNGASGNDVKFWTRQQGGAWTQLGSTVTTAGVTSIASTAQDVFIGAQAASVLPYGGKLFDAYIRNGIGGPNALSVRAADATTSSAAFTERANGATVTPARTTSGYKATLITYPQFILDGANDNMTVSDNAALDFGNEEDFTVLVAVRDDGVSASGYLATKWATGQAGWYMYRTATTTVVNVTDSTTTPFDVGPALTADTAQVVALRRIDSAGSEVEAFLDGTGTGSPSVLNAGDTSNALNFYIGTKSGGGSYFDGGIIAAAVWDTALTDQEIADAGAALAASYDVSEAVLLHGDALWDWILTQPGVVALLSTTDTELVGALNEINGTAGVEYAKARATFLGVPEAG